MRYLRRWTLQALASSSPVKRSHSLLMAALFLLTGCLCAPYLPSGLWLWAMMGIGGLMALCLHKAGFPPHTGLCLCVFVFGILYSHAFLYVPLPDEGEYEVTGYLSGGVTVREEGRLTFVLSDIALSGMSVSGKAYCSLHYEEEAPVLFDGALLRFPGRVYHPDGKTGAPHMDFRLWMLQNGHSFGISTYDEMEILNTLANAPAIDSAYRAQQLLGSILRRQLGDHSRVAMALLLGEREGLTEDEYEAFETLGIAHVMSVSGLHVSLLGGLLTALLNELRLRKGTRMLIVAGFLTFYCWLTGFSAAAIRAAAMLMLYLLCRSTLRSPDRLTLLAASMIAVLLLQPLQAHSAGFVLSFSAMTGILLYANPLERCLEKLHKPSRHPAGLIPRLSRKLLQNLISSFSLSLSAQLGVLLPTMAYFHQLPLYGVLINLLIVPLTSLLVLLYALCLIPFLPIGGMVSALTDLLLNLVKLLSQLPLASIRTASPPAVVCIGLGFAALLLSRRMPGLFRRRVLCALCIIALTIAAGICSVPPALRYIQLSVGRADAALLLDGDQTIVIDTGEDGSEVMDYLFAENRDIDALILTHLHDDHMGGVEAILESGIRIRRIYVPVNADRQQIDEDVMAVWNRILDRGISMIPLASGDELRYNRSMIRVLWPERETVRTGHDANDYPLVLAIELDGYTLLSASDLSGYYEHHAAVAADVLKVAHHGSSGSTGEAFLKHVSPSAALLSSSGAGHLPSPLTLERLKNENVTVLRTDECGDITLSVENGRLSITPYKELLP